MREIDKLTHSKNKTTQLITKTKQKNEKTLNFQNVGKIIVSERGSQKRKRVCASTRLDHNSFTMDSILMECQNAIVFLSTPKRIKTISQSAYLDRVETVLDEGEEGSNLLIPCR